LLLSRRFFRFAASIRSGCTDRTTTVPATESGYLVNNPAPFNIALIANAPFCAVPVQPAFLSGAAFKSALIDAP
jgi:hypothetical protein